MRNERGMTLVEVLIASAILTVFLVGMMGFMGTLSDSTSLHRVRADLLTQGDRVLNTMTETLRSSFIPGTSPNDWQTSLNAGDTQVRFVLPLDFDGDGDVVDAALDPEWGVYREDVTPYSYVLFDPAAASPAQRYYFQSSRTYSESAANVDLNRDGDTNDSFQIGSIILEYPSGSYTPVGGSTPSSIAAGTVRQIGDIVISGDMDGDGVIDPIFLLNGSRLTINLWLTNLDMEEPPVQQVTTDIDLRNM